MAPAITIEYEETPTYPNAYAYTKRYGTDLQHISTCQIFVNPDGDFDALEVSQQQIVIAHEVGHCLGLNHLGEPSLMYRAPLFYGTLTEADIIEFYRAQPQTGRLPIRAFAVVAHN